MTASSRKVPLREQADCAQRELAMRHKVYPGRIKNGKMTEAEAAVEIDSMRAIRDTLRLFAEHETVVRSALEQAIEARKVADANADHPALRALRETFPDAEPAGVRDAGDCDEPPDLDAHVTDTRIVEPDREPARPTGWPEGSAEAVRLHEQQTLNRAFTAPPAEAP